MEVEWHPNNAACPSCAWITFIGTPSRANSAECDAVHGGVRAFRANVRRGRRHRRPPMAKHVRQCRVTGRVRFREGPPLSADFHSVSYTIATSRESASRREASLLEYWGKTRKQGFRVNERVPLWAAGTVERILHRRKRIAEIRKNFSVLANARFL